jgi:hypothetical protein
MIAVDVSTVSRKSPSFFVFFVVKGFFVTGRADDSVASDPNISQVGRK